MICPGCSQTLEKVLEADVEVDICASGCGGVWFDQFEFKKFDEPHEPAQRLLKLLPTKPTAAARPRRNCAKCDGIVMMRAFHSPLRQIEIDECPMCASIWLDHGELTAIRKMFSSEEQLKECRRAAFNQAIRADEAEYIKARAESFERIDRFAGLFRWFGLFD